KLGALLPENRVRLVLPVPRTRWLEKAHPDGRIERRRSPKTGRVEQLFAELVYAPTVLAHPNLELEVVLVEDVEERAFATGKAWRGRGWVVSGRRLVAVLARRTFERPEDLLALLPSELPHEFTTAEL